MSQAPDYELAVRRRRLLAWMLELGITDRDLYRQVRALAWDLKVLESYCSDKQKTMD